jgi:hypothetical protein
VRLVLALRLAAGEGRVLATGEGRKASPSHGASLNVLQLLLGKATDQAPKRGSR